MARSGASKRSERGELWHGYRRPIVRDGAFWLAAVVTVLALAVQNAWSGLDDGLAWGLFVADVLVTAVITFALIGVLAGTVRGFGEGWRSGERVIGQRTTKAEPAGDPVADPVAKPAAEPEPEPAPRPTPDPVAEADRPVIGVELERKARALGRAIGNTSRRTRRP